jgi:hypothetical protein
MIYTKGAYTFDDLNKMPSYKYWLIKRSVDMEAIRQRKLFISDVATAFSDPKKGVTQLERQERQMEQLYNSLIDRKITVDDGTTSGVDWDFHDDAADRMRKYQR